MFKLAATNPFVGVTNSTDGVDEFENSFQEMAYAQLEKTIPEILDRVATFKIADIDLSKGKALGFFIVLFENGTGYVPAILDKEEVRPLDVMYLKEAKSFIPFSKAWIDHIDTLVDPNLGQAETDESQREMTGTSPRDINISNVLIPPRTTRKAITGRSVYAHSMDSEDAFYNFLDEIPNEAKEAVKEAITKNASLLEFVNKNYDIKEVASVLKPHKLEKVASKELFREKVFVVDKEVDSQEQLVRASKLFPKVASDLNKFGTAVLDLRTPPEIINRIQHWEDFKYYDSPNEGDLYLIYLMTGETKKAAVFPRTETVRFDGDSPRNDSTADNDRREDPDPFEAWAQPNDYKYKSLIVFEDGSYAHTSRFLANKLHATAADVINFLLPIISVNPEIGDRGVWISRFGGGYNSTPISIIDRIVTKDATTRYFVSGWSNPGYRVVSQSMDSNLSQPHYQTHSGTVLIPGSAKFLKLGDMVGDSELAKTFDDINNLVKQSQITFSIHKDGNQLYKISDNKNISFPLSKEKVIAKIANDLSVPCNDVDALINYMEKIGENSIDFSIIEKSAAAKKPPTPSQDSTPQEQGPDALSQVIMAQQKMINQLMKQQNNSKPKAKPKPKAPAEESAAQPAEQAAAPAQQAQQPAPQQQMVEPSTGMMNMQIPTQPGMMQGGMQGGGMQYGGMQPGMMQGGMMHPGIMQPSMQSQDMGADPEQELYEGAQVLGGQSFNVNPALLEKVISLGMKSLFESMTIASLGANKSLSELAAKYIPNLRKTLNSIAQSLLVLRYKSKNFREELGDQNYEELENSFSTVLSELGDLVLLINKNSLGMTSTSDNLNVIEKEKPN